MVKSNTYLGGRTGARFLHKLLEGEALPLIPRVLQLRCGQRRLELGDGPFVAIAVRRVDLYAQLARSASDPAKRRAARRSWPRF